MKKALLALLLLAGCQEKGTNRIEINGQVIEGENITISQSGEDSGEIWILHENPFKWPNDTIYIHDTVWIKVKSSNIKKVETHGDNSPAIISDKPVNIGYSGINRRLLGVGELEPHNEYFDHWATKEDRLPILDSQKLKELNEIVRKDMIRMRKLIMKDSLYMKDSPIIKHQQ